MPRNLVFCIPMKCQTTSRGPRLGSETCFVSFFLETVAENNGYKPGLEKSSVLPVLDRFLKLKTDVFLDKKLQNRSIKLCISQDFVIYRLTLSPVIIVHT